MVRRTGLPDVLLCKSPSLGKLTASPDIPGAPDPAIAKARCTKAANRRWQLARIARRNGPPPLFRLAAAIAR